MKWAAVLTLAVFAVAVVGWAQETEGPFVAPTPSPLPDFLELFDESWQERWVVSRQAKYEGRFHVVAPIPEALEGEKGLWVRDIAKHHAISAPLATALDNTDSDLVIQYEVKFNNQPVSCAGAYMKLVSDSLTRDQQLGLDGSTQYSVMFGPDRCGETNKVHLILRTLNEKSGETQEHHLADAKRVMPATSDLSHLYTAVVRVDGTYAVLVDGEVAREGSLAEDFEPPLSPPTTVADADDEKPEDWVDEAQMADPEAVKPEEWDDEATPTIAQEGVDKPEGWLEAEPLMVQDADALEPDSWDEEEDGEWVAPLVANPVCEEAVGCGEWSAPQVRNPAYQGKWRAPRVDNPAYKGEWAPRQVPNPDYYVVERLHKVAPVAGVAFEIWTMNDGIQFDNVWIGTDEAAALAFGEATWRLRFDKEQELKDALNKGGDSWLDKAALAVTEFADMHPTVFSVAALVGGSSALLGVFMVLRPKNKARAAKSKKDD